MSIRLFVADDHPVVVQGIERFATLEADVEIAGTAGDVGGALEALAGLEVDVISLDVQMPGMKGPRTVRAFAERGVPILLFTLHPVDAVAAALVRAGARGYLSKSRPLDEYMATVRELAAGGARFPEPLSALVDEVGSLAPEEVLTERELEVFARLARCDTPKEAAFALGLSPSTVYTHLERIRCKLNLRTHAELVRYAASWDLEGEP